MKMKTKKGAESSVVEDIVKNEDLGTIITSNPTSLLLKIQKHKINDKKKNTAIAVLSIMIIIMIVLIILKYRKPKLSNKNKLDIYEEAYDNLKFKENSNLEKLYCTKNLTIDKNEVDAKEVLIYYFDKGGLETFIFHREIDISDNYMDYYDEMVSQYKKELSNDYSYPNVKSNIVSRKNKILITILTEKSDSAKALELPKYFAKDAAKNSLNSAQYDCK